MEQARQLSNAHIRSSRTRKTHNRRARDTSSSVRPTILRQPAQRDLLAREESLCISTLEHSTPSAIESQPPGDVLMRNTTGSTQRKIYSCEQEFSLLSNVGTQFGVMQRYDEELAFDNGWIYLDSQ